MSSRGLQILSEAQCEDLLTARSFGRIVTKIGDSIAALPVYFTMLDGAIVFQTDPGTKLAAAVMNSQVTFEVDDEGEGWSVMVVGTCEEVRAEEQRAAALEVLAGSWPEGERQRVVRIRPQRTTGRRLNPAPQ